MDDPRKHKRMPVNHSCHLRCEENDTPVLATVLDVSFGGMAIVAPVELRIGSIVEIPHSEFPCASSDRAASKCRVISARPARGTSGSNRMGLCFETSDIDFVQSLLQWSQLQSLVQKRTQPRIDTSRPQWS